MYQIFSRAGSGSSPRAPHRASSQAARTPVETLPRLPLPGAHLVRVHLVARRDRLYGSHSRSASSATRFLSSAGSGAFS